MVVSIKACLAPCIWSSVLLFYIQAASALFISLSEDIQASSHEFFGSFLRSLMSMLELTVGNWVPILRTLFEHNQWYGLVGIFYVCTFNVFMMRVVSGVFFHETSTAACADSSFQLARSKKETASYRKQIEDLFEGIEKSEDGTVNFGGFSRALKDAGVQQKLAAMDLEGGDAKTLFELLDNGDRSLTLHHLLLGVSRLKGKARSIDLAALARRLDRMENHLLRLYEQER